MSSATSIDGASRVTSKVFEPAGLELDRAPVLRGMFEQWAKSLGESMQDLCPSPSSVVLDSLDTGPLSTLLKGCDSGFFALYRCPEWHAPIVIGLDRRFIFSCVDAIYGSDGTEAPIVASRPFSSVETAVSKSISEDVSKRLENLLSVIDRVSLVLETTTTSIEPLIQGDLIAHSLVARIKAQMNSAAGTIFAAIPIAALRPHRKKLQREQPSEQSQLDPGWSKQLLGELGLVDTQLTAVMEGPSLTLHDLATLRVGDVLKMPATIDSLLSLECGGEPQFHCHLGQSRGKFTVQLTGKIDNYQELVKDIVALAGAFDSSPA
ncbi:MAG: FliM/FliN family flagellar motor switch protein [Proteobacteria bacterium]|nr:FliM/FliN family flagellar motor switch protein [Pseudomonadota bacterium]